MFSMFYYKHRNVFNFKRILVANINAMAYSENIKAFINLLRGTNKVMFLPLLNFSNKNEEILVMS